MTEKVVKNNFCVFCIRVYNSSFCKIMQQNKKKQDCLLQGQAQFFHPKVKVKKTISLTSFVFWGLVGPKVLLNFKSFQDLITNVVFYPNSYPPHSCCKGWGWLKNENHGLKCILSHLKPY